MCHADIDTACSPRYATGRLDAWLSRTGRGIVNASLPGAPAVPDLVAYHPKTRAEWRRWLERHHATAPGVWFVFYKKGTGKARVSYDDAVEEALCFGWVDSVGRALDEDRSMLKFTPRKPRSVWSKSNKERVERLIRDGRMTPAGVAKVEAAKRDGSWSALDAAERLAVPPDLEAALAANVPAARHFDAFPPSSKKIILTWITGAKRAETRAKRVAETVRLAERNLRANHYRQ
jgi:uncharacterized protein YdeI (YjbR/CyaY-like superfamily)